MNSQSLKIRVPLQDLGFDEDLIYYAGDERFTGTAFQCYKDGTPCSEQEFLNGLEHGRDRRWYPNGQIKLDLRNHMGAYRDGFLREWYENGQLEHVTLLRSGETIEYKYWDKAGSITKQWLADGEVSVIPDAPFFDIGATGDA